MKRLILSLVLFVAALIVASAQPFNEYREKALSNFNTYRQKKQDDFHAYRDLKNAEMEEYIRKAWEKMPGNEPEHVPIKEDKDIPPVVMPEEDRGKKPEDIPVPIREVIPPAPPQPEPKPLAPIEETPDVSPQLNFFFYGTECSVRFDKATAPKLGEGKEDAVADMWKALCDERYINFYLDCMGIRSRLNLCDWAYFGLSETIAKQIYSTVGEIILLQAAVLIQSGYQVLLARDKVGGLHMLTATDVDVFNHPYWTIDGQKYYLFDGTAHESLFVMTKTVEELRPVRLSLTAENAFADSPTQPRTLKSENCPNVRVNVSTNKNLISFYDGYPESFANNDPYTKWRFYAMVPLSAGARKGLYPALDNAISGKSELDAANILLNFVQTAFVYEYDDKVWGRDRAFFADETLYYPFCDCEDRSILFSRLIRDLMGLDVVLVYYPGHLYTAVRFNSEVTGDYLTVDGNKYIVCDPTFIHAPVGKTMPGMDNGTAIAIKL